MSLIDTVHKDRYGPPGPAQGSQTQSGVKHETQLLLRSEAQPKSLTETHYRTESYSVHQSLTWKAFKAKILPILRKDHLLVN